MNTPKTRIQEFLINLGMAGPFYRVTYDPTTKLPNDVQAGPPYTGGDATPEVPASVYANETAQTFDTDIRQGQRLARKRNSWTFRLYIDFTNEVTAEFFEASIIDPVPVLPPSDGYLPVFMNLTDVSIEHPVQQEPSTGSKFIYTFEAVEGRR